MKKHAVKLAVFAILLALTTLVYLISLGRQDFGERRQREMLLKLGKQPSRP